MENLKKSLLVVAWLLPFAGFMQNNTFSPYSRYGLGEMTQPTFAHNTGMGGNFIALRPDSSMPVFINPGNPASYSLIRLTTLEVGGRFQHSAFKSNSAALNKWTTNFSYGALGFPVGGRGGAVLGIMPYSNVGYNTESKGSAEAGEMTYKYSGGGGLTKAFLGYGVSPFQQRHLKFRRKHYVVDSLKTLSPAVFKLRNFGSKMLSDLSVGANANYIFGNIQQTGRVIYPNSLLYNNTYVERVVSLGDFTGNIGVQTAITIDSVKSQGRKKAMKEKVKFTFGYFMNLNNKMDYNYNSVAYNYILTGAGDEVIRDTVMYNIDQRGRLTLPMEQGIGVGFKKGERIHLVADFALTGWKNFKYPLDAGVLNNNYRVGIGINFVPEKYAAGRGAFGKRINYRLGASYETGYINLKGNDMRTYMVSAGLGLPVGIGRLSSMVNVSLQYGQMGTLDNNLTRENFWRVNFGFTFCDRWFQKFRYD